MSEISEKWGSRFSGFGSFSRGLKLGGRKCPTGSRFQWCDKKVHLKRALSVENVSNKEHFNAFFFHIIENTPRAKSFPSFIFNPIEKFPFSTPLKSFQNLGIPILIFQISQEFQDIFRLIEAHFCFLFHSLPSGCLYKKGFAPSTPSTLSTTSLHH